LTDSAPPTVATSPAELRLARMKRLALALLLGAAALWIAAGVLHDRHAAWPWVGAFAEAAMVGALADWFAVVALFRRPLGLPIPHTAIVPANQARIGRALADFVADHFLGDAAMVARLRAFKPALRLGGWLANAAHAEQVAQHLAGAARHALKALDEPAVRRTVEDAATARLRELDVSQLSGRLLQGLLADRRHQALLDVGLAQTARWLGDEALQARLVEVIASETGVLKVVGLDQMAARMATKRIVAGATRLIEEINDDAQHPLRLRFDDFAARFVEQLQQDEAWRERGRALRDEALAQPAYARALQSLWSELLRWADDDLRAPGSSLRRHAAEAVRGLGQTLQHDRVQQRWLDAQFVAAAPAVIAQVREQARSLIAERVAQWDAQQLSRTLELHLGPDLQYVRFNGTLVGGLIGLLLHALQRVWG
jgi:uncharacterized membrane-anchored protein YjiN (DUF445 family)